MVKKLLMLIALANLSGICQANPPNIDYSHNMRVLKLPRDTKVGTIIYRLKGSDADNDILRFGVRGAIGGSLLDIVAAGFFEADVYLKSPLQENEYQVTIFVTDGVETTEVESTIMVFDNETATLPFIDVQSIFKVLENTSTNQSIGFVTAKEKDASNIPVTFELRGSDCFSIKYVFGPRGTSRAEVILVREIDYEKKNLYALTVLALNAWTNETFDTRNVAQLDILVAVVDVQDTPPTFINLPMVVRIPENTQLGATLFKVLAEDGDHGNQRNLTYAIDIYSMVKSYFSVEEFSGEVILTSQISKIKQEIGTTEPILLKINTVEIVADRSVENMTLISSSSDVALVFVSTENKRPVFKSPILIGSIEENSQTMTPVRWEGASVPVVIDDDPGLNGTIHLEIDDPSDTFMVLPTKGINEISYSIVVKNPNNLDFEKSTSSFNLIIIATDQSAYKQMNQSSLCIIKIKDVNDNFPQFTQRTYEASIPEDAASGSTIIRISATDLDSDNFGKIKFTSINGPLSKELNLNEDTGVITLINDDVLDREKTSEYRLSIEARDDLGFGNRNVTELILKILDINDHRPIFAQSRYDAVLNPDRFSFTQPLMVLATDADEPGTANSNVTYEIIAGNYQDKFVIDAVSGEITLKSPLTIERVSRHIIDENAKQFVPFISLTIRAHDQGIPYQSSLVSVNIHTPDYLNRTVKFYVDEKLIDNEPRRLEIENALSLLTGAKAQVYSIEPKESESLIHAWLLYPTRSDVDLRKLPLIISQLTGKEIEKNINNNKVNNKDVEVAQLAKMDYTTLIWLLLILIIITLLFLIIFIISWCWCCRDQRRRQKMDEVQIIKQDNYAKQSNQTTPEDYRESTRVRSKREAEKSKQAWIDSNYNYNRMRDAYGRPSSAPYYDQDFATVDRQRISSTHSLHHTHPAMYQRVRRMNRQQRVRIDPRYYRQSESHLMAIDDIEDDLSLRGVAEHDNISNENMNLVHTKSKIPPSQMNGYHFIDGYDPRRIAYDYKLKSQTRPKMHYKLDEDMNRAKNTEILFIKTPPLDKDSTGDELAKSASIVDNKSYKMMSPDDSQATSGRLYKRQVSFLDKNGSDFESTKSFVPGIITGTIEEVNEDKPDQSDDKSMELIDGIRVPVSLTKIESKSTSDQTDFGNQLETHRLRLDHKVDPVGLSQSSASDPQNKKPEIVAGILKTRRESLENSEKSEDSDSGIGHFGKNGNLELKNIDRLEKKSIFTIAYNEVKTRNIKSPDSDD